MVLTDCYVLSLTQDIFLKCFMYFTKIFKEVTHYCKIGTFFLWKDMLRNMLNWVEQIFIFDCAIYLPGEKE